MKIKGAGFTLVLVSLSFSLNAQVPPPLDTALIESQIFEGIEVEPSFPGGLSAWRKFLEKNLNAVTPVNNGAPEGYYTVIVRFVVAKDGSVIDVKALTKIGYGMEAEVVRIIKKSGNWIPGIQNEKKVNSYHTQPVTFVVDDDEIEITTAVPNKLFAGIDNRISIAVNKVKPEDLSVTVTNGKITPLGDGDFNVKPIDTTRRTVITVYNAKKKDKEIGAVSFEVRPAREAPDAKKD